MRFFLLRLAIISLIAMVIPGTIQSAVALTSVSATGTSAAACNQSGSNLGNAGDVTVTRTSAGE